MSSFCPTCEDLRETRREAREETYRVRGQDIKVPVLVEVCANCGEALGDDEQDRQVTLAVFDEYRRQHNLLSPQRIREIRELYCLSQKSFAALLGMSEATINRYEQGSLQDQTHDSAIRACENPEFVHGLLQRRGNLLSDWQRKRVEEALAGHAEACSTFIRMLSSISRVSMPQEVSECTGYRQFDYRRFAAVVTWLCTRLGSVSRTVINKLLFYTDFLNFKTSTVSLTGTAYRKLQYGPVPADYGQLLDQMEADEYVSCSEVEYPNGSTGFYYQPGPKAEQLEIEFSPHEQRVLEYVAHTLGRLNAGSISSRSHEESAWQNTEDKQLISYTEAANLSLSLDE